MSHELSVKEQIDQVERRLELRRDRFVRHFDEARENLKASVGRVIGWLPLVAVAGGLAVGLAAAKYPRHAGPFREPVQYAPVRVESPPSATPRNVLATIIGIAAMALRIGASKEARTFWNAVRAFRERRREHAR